MNGQAGNRSPGVRLLPPDSQWAAVLGAQRVAELTHLPTGIASGQLETVDVPAGASAAAMIAAGGENFLHVVTGHAQVRWGAGLEHELPVGAGDTVLVPAGTTYRADNSGQAEVLRFILVRGA